MEKLSCKLTIFEGPDGSGKSRAAKAYAEETGARYVHFPAMLRVTKGLARMYVEAMLPALLGYQDVVFDRCWLSEMPYGIAHREGFDRMTSASRRMLERLAWRCGGVVVMCDPGWDMVLESYKRRKHVEMLDNEEQLKAVYDLYQGQPNGLPEVWYNYAHDETQFGWLDEFRATRHPVGSKSAGNLDGSIIIVGESFAERKEPDPFYQAPFVSFSNEGCSQWLTDRIANTGINEGWILWLNSDQDLSFLLGEELFDCVVFTLGENASKELGAIGVQHVDVPHPQYWKRFHANEKYPLITTIEARRWV